MKKENLWSLKEKLASSHNLIHCITNPISINDCANALLAIGARPIMAQHPEECVQITSQSKALAINLGNFNDIRALAIQRSAAYSQEHNIPIVLDAVGVGCSDLRLTYALKIIEHYHPTIVKGNLSELKALAGKPSHALGIDVGEDDCEDVKQSRGWIKELAKTWQCTILCSGKVDIISNGEQTFLVHNGHEMMGICTGTGCMLNVLCAAYASLTDACSAAVFATTLFGITAQKCYETAKTPGQFHIGLFDWLYAMQKKDFMEMEQIEEII